MDISEITVDALRSMASGTVTILDVGEHAGKAEIRGAVRYRPHDLLRPERLVLPLAPQIPIVLYDQDGRADLTHKVADKLRGSGYSNVRILQGGFAAWHDAGGETQEASLEQLVPATAARDEQALDRRI
jgi:rhodanese-related sulfurtransferase